MFSIQSLCVCLHACSAGPALLKQTSDILLPPPSNPALMTITSDGVVRIWIEVVLSPTFGPDVSALTKPRSPRGSPRGSPSKRSSPVKPSQSLPAQNEANLCVGLVISPVGDLVASGGSWRACWGVPQDPPGFPRVGTGARAHSVLWLTVMQTADSSSSASGPASVAASALLDARAEPKLEQTQGQLSLWAIDGLAGVVLGGAFAAAASGQLPASPVPRHLPRAMLWGQHRADLAWPGVPYVHDAALHIKHKRC